MNVSVDITQELALIIAERIRPAQLVGACLIWSLRSGVLTANNVQLANGAYGMKAVKVDRPAGDNEVLVAIDLAFELIEFIRKEGKRQVAPSTAPDAGTITL